MIFQDENNIFIVRFYSTFLLFYIASQIVIAPPTIATAIGFLFNALKTIAKSNGNIFAIASKSKQRAKTIAVAIVDRAITLWEAI